MNKISIKLILIILFIASLYSCERPDIVRKNKVENNAIEQIENHVIVQTYVLDVANNQNFEFGNLIYLSNEMDDFQEKTVFLENRRTVQYDTITSLISEDEYIIRPYMEQNGNVIYGAESSFTPSIAPELVVFTEFNGFSDLPRQIIVTCNVDNTGSFIVENFGYEYRERNQGQEWIKKTFTDSFQKQIADTIDNIDEGIEHEIRFFVLPENSEQIVSQTFNWDIEPISVVTTNYILLGSGSVRFFGTINPGSYEVTNFGFCYSNLTSNPTLNNEQIDISGEFQNTFQIDVFGLEQADNYYFRAFAMVGNQIYYGNIIEFETP